MGSLHNDLGASADTGDRYHWYSSTGWIMWNTQVGALLGGTTVCVYDGNPGVNPHRPPTWACCGALPAAAGATFFGAGAAFYANCLKAGVEPMQEADLSRLRAIGSTGSPLATTCYDWIWQHLPKVDGQRHLDRRPSAAAPTSPAPSSAACATLPVVARRDAGALPGRRSRPGATRCRRPGRR
jgi:hypothetical protein